MIYLGNEEYEPLIDALLNPPRCPVTGQVDRDAIKIILGERANVWPMGIQDDAENSFSNVAKLQRLLMTEQKQNASSTNG